MDFEHGCGISKNSETHPEVIDESDSIKHFTIHAEDFVIDGNLFPPAKKLQSSSSSSSNSSLEDLFVAETNSLPKPHEDAHPTLKDLENDNNGSSVSEANHESILQPMSQKQSPPIQVMDRLGGSEGYDPNRIPSVVFARSRSTTPVDWRVASSESLFSIHVGDNSFSADHGLWLDGEVVDESGELTKPGELIFLNPLVEPTGKIVETEKKLEATGVLNVANVKDRGELKLHPLTGSWNSSTTSHFHNSHNSNGSESSTHSFSFPILMELKADAEELQHSQPRSPQPEASSKVTSNSCAKSCLSCFLCWLPYCSCRCG